MCLSVGGDNQCSGEYVCRFQNQFGTPNRISHAQVCYCPGQVLNLMMSGLTLPPGSLINQNINCIMLLGANPAVANRRFWQDVHPAKARGAKLIVLDPRYTESAQRASLWLQPRPGTDAALMLGMANVITNENLYDQEFVANYCYGWSEFVKRANEYSAEKVEKITWVPAEKIKEAARIYATNKVAIIMRGMGAEMSWNALRSMQMNFILPAITGQLNLPGGNTMMVGHPRIRVTGEIEDSDKLSREQKRKLIGAKYLLFSWEIVDWLKENVKKITDIPLSLYYFGGMAHAPSVYRAMLTDDPYPVRAMLTFSQNPLLTFANSKLVYRALKKLDLHVVMDVFMTPSCQMADYVLPAAGALEKPLLWGGEYWPVVEGGTRVIEPLHERQDEYSFLRELGLRFGQDWPWETLEQAYDFRLEPMGVTFREFTAAGPGYGINIAKYDLKQYEKVGFGTPSGKYELVCSLLQKGGYDPLPRYDEPAYSIAGDPELAKKFPLILISGHRESQHSYHSQFKQFKSFRKREPYPMAQLHPQKALELGINDGDWMWIETSLGRARFKCKHFSGINPQVVAASHGWWFPEEPGEEPSLHGLWRSNINAVVDDKPSMCDPLSGAWSMREQLCKVYKAEN